MGVHSDAPQALTWPAVETGSEALDESLVLLVGPLNMGVRTVGCTWTLKGFKGEEIHKNALST